MTSKEWVKNELSSSCDCLTTTDRIMLSKILQDLERLEAIDNANPNEALERYHNGDVLVSKADSRYEDEYLTLEDDEEYQTIKQALLKSQEQEKVLKIIKEKRVIIDLLIDNSYLEDYNNKIIIIYGYASSAGRLLTQEEFDLLKESLNKKIN